MRWAAILLLLLEPAFGAPDRPWQTGKCVDVGVSHNLLVGDPRSTSAGTAPYKSTNADVGRYVIETTDARYIMEDIIPLGGPGSFDLAVTVGRSVTFAVQKSAVYIKGDGIEWRLRLVKKNRFSFTPLNPGQHSDKRRVFFYSRAVLSPLTCGDQIHTRTEHRTYRLTT